MQRLMPLLEDQVATSEQVLTDLLGELSDMVSWVAGWMRRLAGGGERGAYSIVAGLSRMTIDHTSLAKQSRRSNEQSQRYRVVYDAK